MAGGRPTDYKPEYPEQARKLCKLGAIDVELADFFGVTVQTIGNWKAAHEEFFAATKLGKDESDARVEKSLYHRALGYSHDAVKIMAVDGAVVREEYREHYPPDTTAAIFWLKNRKPKEWRDIKAVEMSGIDGGPIQTQAQVVEIPAPIADVTAWAASAAVSTAKDGDQ